MEESETKIWCVCPDLYPVTIETDEYLGNPEKSNQE
jgi:hypothetical protein